MANKTETQSTNQDIRWNDQVSTGILRVVMYSTFAYRFWHDFFKGYGQVQTDWWTATFAVVTTIFIFTSAGWAVRKWLERREANHQS